MILCVACKPEGARVAQLQAPDTTATVDELHDSDYGIFHFDYSVTDELIFSLQLQLPERKALLFTQASGPILQEFKLGEDLNMDDGYYAENPETIFSLQDVNFDGYTDISFIRTTGVANTWSDYYLFDPKTKKWQFQEELSEHANLSVDDKNRQLNFHNKGGFGGAWYESGTIEWINSKPLLIRKEEQTSDGENTEVFIRTIWTYSNGELKVASKVRISEIETGEKQCLLEGEWEEFDRTPFLIFANTEEQVTRVDGRAKGCQ